MDFASILFYIILMCANLEVVIVKEKKQGCHKFGCLFGC